VTDFIEVNNNLLARKPAPLVAILMGVKDGSRFLPDQLDSLQAQTHQNWVLIASDDGSTDDTLTILKAYQAKWPAGRLIIKDGPKQGFCANFQSMACDPSIKADYYAFCDQDDVWLSAKLAVAIQHISENQEEALPYLYCSRTTYVNEELKKIGCSRLFSFPRTFRNALVQSIAGGNTMVFNQVTKELLEKVGPVKHPFHDWWLYQLVAGADGIVYYDPIPQILYRQHKDSIVGGGNSLNARIERISQVFKGRFRYWCDQNILALSIAKPFITRGNQEILELFSVMRTARLKDRFRLMEVCGLYRQTWPGTISLLIAALFKKI
jgi:glycosyltransferase involved in cell wall biosynthesis